MHDQEDRRDKKPPPGREDLKLDEAFARLRSTEEFRIVMEDLITRRPLLLPMKPDSDYQAEAGRMMYESGQLNGFDLLYTYLRGRK
jgi:hypothetical protein